MNIAAIIDEARKKEHISDATYQDCIDAWFEKHSSAMISEVLGFFCMAPCVGD